MNDLIPEKIKTPVLLGELPWKVLERLDSGTLLALGAMVCFTTLACVACVCFSGSEMTLSQNGMRISQPASAA